ncbi:MAG: chloride channel protein [Verrucomicrobiota bacterium]|jgi:CIC family chloride channel protein|nr:chloride channel protein [Verrucomicrobiota bacterium]
MLAKIKKLFVRTQKPAYQAGTNLLLVLVLSVVVGAGVSYGTLGFMKAFDSVLNWVYYQWSDYPSGRYTHKFDPRNNVSFDFRGANTHGLAGLKQKKWADHGTCRIVTTAGGVRSLPVETKWRMEGNQTVLIEPVSERDGNPLADENLLASKVQLKFKGKHLVPASKDLNSTIRRVEGDTSLLPHAIDNERLLFKYKQGSFTDVPKWHILLALTLGGLFIGALYRALKLARGHGPADAIIARISNDGILPIKEGIGTALICISSIGLGASVGRYGPAVHLGATLGSGFSTAFNLGRVNTVTFLGCGVASAIATSFNTPIAAVIFAHEAIIGHYSLRAFAPITIAAVTGNEVAKMNGRFFDGFQNLTQFTELVPTQYPLFAVVGLISAVFALIYMRSLVTIDKMMRESRIPQWLRPAIAGLSIGIIAIWLPNLLGLVEETTSQVIQDQGVEYTLKLLCLLIVFKIASTALCLGSGMHGGVFGPALCFGAMVGAAFAMIYDPSQYQIFALASMGACISSVVGAPISTILIVFELNQNYSVATAVMVSVVVSNLVTNRFFARSFFLFQVQAAGFDINAGREVLILGRRTIREVMESQFHTIDPEADLKAIEQALRKNPDADLYVTEEGGRLLGGITLGTAWDALREGGNQTARDLARMPDHWLTEDTDLNRGFEVIEEFVGISVPVVDNPEDMRLTGIIHEANVIQAYNEAVKEARGEEQGLD